MISTEHVHRSRTIVKSKTCKLSHHESVTVSILFDSAVFTATNTVCGRRKVPENVYLDERELSCNNNTFAGCLNGKGNTYSLFFINVILNISQDKFSALFWSQHGDTERKYEPN